MKEIVASNATDQDPEIAEITAFLAVVEARSYGAAARSLSVSKSTVSRRVAQLEDKLGVRLLQRTTRKLALTELGHAYHEQVVAALGNLNQAAAAVREHQSTPRGYLRVTAPVDLGGWLPQLITEFQVAYPEVVVEVELTQRKIDLVGEGFDLGIRAGALRDSTLIARRVCSLTSILVASPGYLAAHTTPKRPSDLPRHTFVLFHRAQQRGQSRLVLRGRRGQREVQVRGQLIAADFNFVRDAAVAGAGIALIPNLLVQQALARGELMRVLPAWDSDISPIHLVYPTRAYVPAKLRAFLDFAARWSAAELEP
ncbi:MAG: LysR family transcriptional regulator [Nannocystaceae bacterium]